MFDIFSTATREFNELVNMKAEDLKTWLEGEQSQGAGWSKDDGSGETIGHERCRVVRTNMTWPIILTYRDVLVVAKLFEF